MSLTLTSQANALLSQVIKQQGSLPIAVEQKLAEMGQAVDAKPVTIEQVEKLCRDAMPSATQQKLIDRACEHGRGYHHHPDGKNNSLLTQILATRVRVVENFTVPQPALPPRRSDPFYADFTMDKNAQSMLLFNARDVDRNGNALLMKVVVRMDPATEQKLADAQTKIDALLASALTALPQANRALTPDSIRAFMGLPSEEADANHTNWLNGTPAHHPYRTEMAPLLAAKKSIEDAFIATKLPSLDLSSYRRADPKATPDVALVGASATFVSTEDIDNAEFTYGDPLKQVSLDRGGKEISTSVAIAPENTRQRRGWSDAATMRGRQVANDVNTTASNLDRQPVMMFDDRIKLSLKSVGDKGGWIRDAAPVDGSLHIGRGLIFEPGAKGTVKFGPVTANVAVAGDDAQLLGNQPQTIRFDPKALGASLAHTLISPVDIESHVEANKSDRGTTSKRLIDLVFSNASQIAVGANPLAPLADVAVGNKADLKANKMSWTALPLSDPQNDGACVTLRLEEGFLAKKGNLGDVAGYEVQVGYFDNDKKWIEAKRFTVAGDQSKATEFSFDLDSLPALQKTNANLEVRLYNADGVPAQRMTIPFRAAEYV
jgi:hypothetical protein